MPIFILILQYSTSTAFRGSDILYKKLWSYATQHNKNQGYLADPVADQ